MTPPTQTAWTTPRRLQTTLAVLWLLAAALLVAVLAGAGERRTALQAIGREAAPRLVGAQRIKAGLSDMDAAAADVLLLPAGVAQEGADDHYEARRVEVTENLASAAQSAGSAGERQSVRTLSDALGTYETNVAQARLLHLRGELGSRLVYRVTHSEMHDTLLPAADALRDSNSKALEAAYTHAETASAATLALVWTFGLLLLAGLIAAQFGLQRLTHRTFNLPLLGATLVTLLLLVWTAALFSRADAALKTAKTEAFSSVSRLWEMRATAFDANAEESRWLMDTPQAPQYEQSYGADTAKIADALQADGALTAADSTYDAADRQMRTLENSGRHAAAVTFCVGRKPGQLGGAFAQLDDAVGHTLDQSQASFDDAVSGSAARQAGDALIASAAGLFLLALIGLGLRVRLREYGA